MAALFIIVQRWKKLNIFQQVSEKLRHSRGRIIFCNKKEQITGTCVDTNGSQVHYVTRKKQTWKIDTIYCFGDMVFLKMQSLRVGMQASNGQRVGGGC